MWTKRMKLRCFLSYKQNLHIKEKTLKSKRTQFLYWLTPCEKLVSWFAVCLKNWDSKVLIRYVCLPIFPNEYPLHHIPSNLREFPKVYRMARRSPEYWFGLRTSSNNCLYATHTIKFLRICFKIQGFFYLF